MLDAALKLLGQLRLAGFSAIMDYKRSSLGKQLKQAAAQDARFAVILGQETIRDKLVTLKDMADGSQRQISLEELAGSAGTYL